MNDQLRALCAQFARDGYSHVALVTIRDDRYSDGERGDMGSIVPCKFDPTESLPVVLHEAIASAHHRLRLEYREEPGTVEQMVNVMELEEMDRSDDLAEIGLTLVNYQAKAS